MPGSPVLLANGRKPVTPLLDRVESRIEFHRQERIPGKGLDIGDERSLNRLGQRGVLLFRDDKGLPGSTRAYATSCFASHEYLFGDVKGREHPARGEMRDVIDESEQRARVNRSFAHILVTAIRDFLKFR